jgi:cellulose synthase/poly-beta-1,6-N-acetylglucosamine synthase-like glycosyltransferase
MTILAVILTVLCSLVFLVWSARHLAIGRAKRDNTVLTADSPGAQASAGKVSILIAAKDEEETIEACVRSMLMQDYADFEVIVINDRSSDRTAEIVQGIADEDPRLRLINVEDLPEGWSGKNHAMWRGAAVATGDWLCLSDADCRQTSCRTVSVALRHAADNGVDLLSVLPNLEMKGFWENVVQPVCSGVMIIWYNPEKVNSPARPHAYANGAFILFRREAYDAVGGHESVKPALMEDLHLAERVKRAGRKLKVVQNDGLYTVRMYTSFRKIVNGWCRIFFGTFGTKRRLRVSMAIMFVMGLLPYITAAAGWATWAAGGGAAWLAAAIMGSAAAAMQVSVIARFYRLAKAKWWLCWTYPLGCVIAIVSLVKAYRKHRPGAQVVWRSTAYATGSPK